MTYDATEARNHFLIGKALMMAVALDQSQPQDQREFNDTRDRLVMLRDLNHVSALAEFAFSVKRKTGLTVDLYEDVRPDQLKAHRQNFAEAMRERGALVA